MSRLQHRNGRLQAAIFVSLAIHALILLAGRASPTAGDDRPARSGPDQRGRGPVHATIRKPGDVSHPVPDASSESGPDADAAPSRLARTPTGVPIRYFPIGAVDIKPRAVDYVAPAPPARPLWPATEPEVLRGTVVMWAYLGPDGRVDAVAVEDLGGLPAFYGEAAASALRASRFEPGLIAGRPVGVKFRVVAQFGWEP